MATASRRTHVYVTTVGRDLVAEATTVMTSANAVGSVHASVLTSANASKVISVGTVRRSHVQISAMVMEHASLITNANATRAIRAHFAMNLTATG